MNNIVLIACSKQKESYPCEASKLYSKSTLFHSSLAYARSFCCPIFILSAKYGLVSENQIIAPYDETLSEKTTKEKQIWGEKVIADLKKNFDFSTTKFIILAGRNYYKPLCPYLIHYELPLEGKRLGERLAFLASYNQNSLCLSLHKLFWQLPRYHFNTINDIPWNNGIYIMFETNENYGSGERIVRVGTHKADGRLKKRLRDHFLSQNKNGSIFRKNVGKAILYKENNPLLALWTSDRTDEALDETEAQVSEYLHKNISFICFPVSSKEQRLRYEEGIISVLNQTENFLPSDNWLGLYSPVASVKGSGLWLTQGLNGIPLTYEEFLSIAQLCNVPYDTTYKVSGNTSSACVAQTIHPQIIAPKQPGIHEVIAYLENKLKTAKNSDLKTITICSGELHSEMRLTSRMPTVCNAMYKLLGPNDIIVVRPPKGKGSRLIITYKL